MTVVESCSAAAFATSLDHVLNASALAANATVRHAVAARYGAFAGREIAVAAGAWAPSRHALVLGLSEGTTGTRWLADVFTVSGFASAHGFDRAALAACETEKRCSAAFDGCGFVCDSPTPAVAFAVQESHANALGVLTMRDPWAWQASRVRNHDAGSWRQFAPGGGGADHDMRDARAPYTFLAYAAWVACVWPRDRLLVANVFDRGGSATLRDLRAFLAARGLKAAPFPDDTPVAKVAHLQRRAWRGAAATAAPGARDPVCGAVHGDALVVDSDWLAPPRRPGPLTIVSACLGGAALVLGAVLLARRRRRGAR